MNIKVIAEEIHENAKEKGWWETERNIPELLCLVHSEVSGALEAYRVNDMKEFGKELADVVIRVFDICEGFDINIEKEIIEKNEFNKKRAYKHGNKKC